MSIYACASGLLQNLNPGISCHPALTDIVKLNLLLYISENRRKHHGKIHIGARSGNYQLTRDTV